MRAAYANMSYHLSCLFLSLSLSLPLPPLNKYTFPAMPPDDEDDEATEDDRSGCSAAPHWLHGCPLAQTLQIAIIFDKLNNNMPFGQVRSWLVISFFIISSM